MNALDTQSNGAAAAGELHGKTRDPRGRDASSPTEIPWRGWRDVLLRVKHEANHDNIGLVAAGMAFYAMLSVAPTLAFIISVYGLLVTPEGVQSQVTTLSTYLPADAGAMITSQLQDVANAADRSLGWGIVFAALLSLWSASKAMRSLFGGLNAVYDEVETRGFVQLTAQSLLFTLAGICVLILMLGVFALLPLVLKVVALPVSENLVRLFSWLLIGLVAMCSIAVLYRFGPARSRPQWRWVTVGAVVALVLWLGSSAGLSWYVSNFDSYQKTYGALGAMVVLLMWFFLSAYAVLLGGELNAELEHQTAVDSTIGAPRPDGEPRGRGRGFAGAGAQLEALRCGARELSYAEMPSPAPSGRCMTALMALASSTWV